MPKPAAGPPILISGAAGFIGGAMAVRLASSGRPVVAFDLPGRPSDHLVHPLITRVEGDVTSPADCARALAAGSAEAIVHCAALMGAAAPREEYLRVNRGGSESLAGAAADAGVRRFIYISSVTVHGMAASDRIDEGSPIRSIGLPYADSKIEAERSLEAMHERGRIELTILRPGDVYGPRAGEWVVKLVQALRTRRMILIDGGRGLINTTYVENLTDAVLASLARNESRGRTYLITDGSPVSWKRYLVALASACGARAPSISVPSMIAWPLVLSMEAALSPMGKKPPLGRMGLRLLTARSGYSIARARRELGWSPAVDFDEGMRRVGEWVREAMPARG